MTSEEFYNRDKKNKVDFDKTESEQLMYSSAHMVEFAEAYHTEKMKELTKGNVIVVGGGAMAGKSALIEAIRTHDPDILVCGSKDLTGLGEPEPMAIMKLTAPPIIPEIAIINIVNEHGKKDKKQREQDKLRRRSHNK